MRNDAQYYLNLERNLSRHIGDEEIDALMREKGLKRILTTALMTNKDSESHIEYTLRNELNTQYDERHIIRDTPKRIKATMLSWLQSYNPHAGQEAHETE